MEEKWPQRRIWDILYNSDFLTVTGCRLALFSNHNNPINFLDEKQKNHFTIVK